MSRCFPYPPPGYTPSRASNDALIESIKLQKERDQKSKAERKKERKEKKKEKKEKKKAKEEKTKLTKAVHLDHDVKNLGHGKGGEIAHKKERKDDTEQLERSSITEEHEQPICSQNPSYSSDSTQNSGKRKRPASPVNATRVQGNILRIRLPSQKHIKYDIKDIQVQQPISLPTQKLVRHDIVGDDEELPVRLPSQILEIRGGEQQLCSTSGRTDVLEHNSNVRRADNDRPSTKSLAAELFVNDDPLRSEQKLTAPNPVERHSDANDLEYLHIDSSSKRYRKLRKVADQYRDLVEGWTAPSSTTVNDEDDWLLGRKNEGNRQVKVLRGGAAEMTCSGSSTLWPRAHYLPDADIYALPFAIPF